MKFLSRCLFSMSLSFQLSLLVSSFMFTKGTTSYSISTIGLGLVLLPTFYQALYRAFATQVLIVDSKAFAEQMEKELQKLKDEQ